jgi:hypothetical protein
LATIGSNYSYDNSRKEDIMSESNKNNSNSGTENPPASTDKPNVPVPPPPAGSQSGQIHTHADDSSKVIRVTEDRVTKDVGKNSE